MVELVIIACLLAHPAQCISLRLPTGYINVQRCEADALILVAGTMMSYPEHQARHYHCERIGPMPFEGKA